MSRVSTRTQLHRFEALPAASTTMPWRPSCEAAFSFRLGRDPTHATAAPGVAGFKSFPDRSELTFDTGSLPSLGRTAAARATSSTRSPGCLASRAPRACAATDGGRHLRRQRCAPRPAAEVRLKLSGVAARVPGSHRRATAVTEPMAMATAMATAMHGNGNGHGNGHGTASGRGAAPMRRSPLTAFLPEPPSACSRTRRRSSFATSS